MNMKKTALLIAIGLFAAMFLVGCASVYPVGGIYTGVTLPVNVTSNVSDSPKMGTAECRSYFGIVAVGDASIYKAMENGGIKKIHYVDWNVENILGIIGTYKVTVYGE